MKYLKKIFLLEAAVLFIVLAAQAQAVQVESAGAPGELAKFNWNETTHNFEQIVQGKPVSFEFSFTNTGGAPLVISDVKGSCGCTVTEYTKEPVLPGKSGIVKATFNAAAMGAFNKSIRVTANVEGGTETLYIKGEVVKEPS
jgi:hypothetical protein